MGFNLQDYEQVDVRLEKFWAKYPNGRVATEVVLPAPDNQWIVRAYIYRDAGDPNPFADGTAHEVVGSTPVNKTAALENCETSAIGRALANGGFAAKGKRASREEMDKASRAAEVEPRPAPKRTPSSAPSAHRESGAAVSDPQPAAPLPEPWSEAELQGQLGAEPADPIAALLAKGVTKGTIYAAAQAAKAANNHPPLKNFKQLESEPPEFKELVAKGVPA